MAWHIRTAVLFAIIVPLSLVAADPPRAVDRFGDLLPDGALMRLGTTRFRSPNVLALAFAPDGSFLATGGDDSPLRFLHTETGQQLKRPESKQAWVHNLAFAPNGKTFVTAANGTLRLRETATGRDLQEWELQPNTWTQALEFSADGKQLAVQVHGNPMGLREVRDGKEVAPRSAPFPKPSLVACSTGLRHFAAVDPEQTLHVWESKNGRILGKLRKFPESRFVCLSPEGHFIAASGETGTPIRLWEVASGKELSSCPGHAEELWRMAFSPDERWLASADLDRTICLWDATAGKQRWRFKADCEHSPYVCFRFSPDGKRFVVAAGDGVLRVLDVGTCRQVSMKEGHQGPVTHTLFLGEAGRLVTAGTDRTVRVWDGATAKELCQLSRPNAIQSIAGSADGTLLAVVEDLKLRLLDVATAKEVRRLNKHQEPICSVAFSPHGSILATAGARWREVTLWDVQTGERLQTLESEGGRVSALCFSRDGRLLAGSCGDLAIRIWSVERGGKPMELRGTQGRVSPLAVLLAFAPDARSLASVGSDGSYSLWEIVTRQQRRFEQHDQNRIQALAWSPDGRLLAHAGSDPTICICDVLRGCEVTRLSGHESGVSSLAFSPDGRRLVSGSLDTSALIWKVPAPSSAVNNLKPDEARLLIEAMDGKPVAEAFTQMSRFAATPGLPRILREYLPPATKEDGTRMVELIRDLDSNRFRVRERAAAELTKYGERAWPLLRRTLEGGPTLEMRRRVERLLEAEKDGPSPALVRRQRLLELLEMSGGAEAIRVLKELAAGDPEADLTREAREGLERLARRPR